MDKFLNIAVVMAITLFVAIPLLVLVKVDIDNKGQKANEQVEILRENDIGCKKILYKGDSFWTCPKDFNVETVSKRICQQSGSTTNCRTVTETVATKDLD